MPPLSLLVFHFPRASPDHKDHFTEENPVRHRLFQRKASCRSFHLEIDLSWTEHRLLSRRNNRVTSVCVAPWQPSLLHKSALDTSGWIRSGSKVLQSSLGLSQVSRGLHLPLLSSKHRSADIPLERILTVESREGLSLWIP